MLLDNSDFDLIQEGRHFTGTRLLLLWGCSFGNEV